MLQDAQCPRGATVPQLVPMEGPLCFLDEGFPTATATDAGTVADTMERDHIV